LLIHFLNKIYQIAKNRNFIRKFTAENKLHEDLKQFRLMRLFSKKKHKNKYIFEMVLAANPNLIYLFTGYIFILLLNVHSNCIIQLSSTIFAILQIISS